MQRLSNKIDCVLLASIISEYRVTYGEGNGGGSHASWYDRSDVQPYPKR